MTATATRPARKRKAQKQLRATLGPLVCRWIERHLVHAEGDMVGKPFKLRDFQRAFIWRAYELDRNGRRHYRRALWGLPTGNGKTEIAAALSIAEMAGPVTCTGFRDGRPLAGRKPAPDVPMAAASYEQADLLFSAASTMIREGPLRDEFDVFEREIVPKDGRPGRLYRVAARAGTNDGRKPTFFLGDELHEWDCTCGMPGGRHVGACKARVYVVLSKGRAKRRDAWELAISTAGWNLHSLLGTLYQAGRAGTDKRFLFDWHGLREEDDRDLSDPVVLEAALREVNPGLGDFLSLEEVVADWKQMTESEFRRYHLNQWVSGPEEFLPAATWAGCKAERTVPDGARVVLGFDGSYSRDSTALVGATVEPIPHLFVVDCWENPEDPEWRVDILDVEQAVRNACQRWRVTFAGCDPPLWHRSLQLLESEGFPIVEWPTRIPSRISPACTQFVDAVMGQRVTHDGDERLTRHLAHAIVKRDSRGPRISKDHMNSVHHIDLAVAAIIAYDLALRALSGTVTSQAWGLI